MAEGPRPSATKENNDNGTRGDHIPNPQVSGTPFVVPADEILLEPYDLDTIIASDIPQRIDIVAKAAEALLEDDNGGGVLDAGLEGGIAGLWEANPIDRIEEHIVDLIHSTAIKLNSRCLHIDLLRSRATRRGYDMDAVQSCVRACANEGILQHNDDVTTIFIPDSSYLACGVTANNIGSEAALQRHLEHRDLPHEQPEFNNTGAGTTVSRDDSIAAPTLGGTSDHTYCNSTSTLALTQISQEYADSPSRNGVTGISDLVPALTVTTQPTTTDVAPNTVHIPTTAAVIPKGIPLVQEKTTTTTRTSWIRL